MSSALFYRAGATGIAALTAVAMISGCGSSKKSTASATTATSPAAATSSAAVATPTPAASSAPAAAASAPTAAQSSAAAAGASNLSGSLAALEASASALEANATAKVVATGGGKFCKDVATSINQSESQAAGTTSSDSTKQEIAEEQALEKKALGEAPNAIKPDIVTLFSAENQLDAALAAVNYDYSKLDPSKLAAMQSPAVLAASQRVTAYLKNTCGIDTGDDESP